MKIIKCGKCGNKIVLLTKMEKEIINIIKKNPWLNISEIAKIHGVKQPAITKHISNLEKSGLLKIKFEKGYGGISKRLYVR